ILPNDAEDRFVLEGEAALGQPMGAELARNNMLLCDLELLMLEISGQLDDLHSVCKRQRNVIAHVRRRYEKDVAQVIIDFEVMIGKRMILFGVQDLEQSRTRIATKVHGHLIDLVQ